MSFRIVVFSRYTLTTTPHPERNKIKSPNAAVHDADLLMSQEKKHHLPHGIHMALAVALLSWRHKRKQGWYSRGRVSLGVVVRRWCPR